MAIVDSISRVMGRASYTKPLKKLGQCFEKHPEDALAAATVLSILFKDGIGCAMYVTQSLNNKKIPEEKRKFVAALDLTNGGLMIVAQIAMFLAMRKYSGPLFKKLFAKSFSDIAKSNTITRIRRDAAKAGRTVAKKLKIEKVFDKVEKSGLDVFKFILDTSAATIVGKRIIVPLIATPFAKKVEKWMDKNNGEKAEDNSSDKVNANPPMTGKDVPNQPVPVAKSEPTNLIERYKQNIK